MAKTISKTPALKNTAQRTALKSAATKAAALKPPALKAAAIKAAVKPTALKLKETPAPKPPVPELVHSHPTMCLHCHLIVEMFHERGADPLKGAWQCPRCAHKYLFTHWKIKRQARGKSEAA
jgi:hypothetical protein